MTDTKSKAIAPWVGPWPTFEARVADTIKYKPGRLALAAVVAQILDQLNVRWFIEGGTLLGAFRDGTMLAHDDDFDLAFCVTQSELDQNGGPDAFLTKLCDDVAGLLSQHKPADPACEYKTRTALSYCKKIEIYDAASGSYPLQSASHADENLDFHNVTVDLTLLIAADDAMAECQHSHRIMQHVKPPGSVLYPTTKIHYEGSQWPAPADPEAYLSASYGYLGKDAVFDPETSLYRKRTADD